MALIKKCKCLSLASALFNIMSESFLPEHKKSLLWFLEWMNGVKIDFQTPKSRGGNLGGGDVGEETWYVFKLI